MKKLSLDSIRTLRFWLEIIAIPFFIFLVIHLSGHGMMTFFEGHHEHASNTEIQIDDDHGESIHNPDNFSEFFTEETVFGILLLLIFVWIWHRPALKKWVPCAHEHCHESSWTHIAAIIAFCIHFFPEAEVRYSLLQNFDIHSLVSFSTLIGFGLHFSVDILVTLLLISYFPNVTKKIIALLVIIAIWIVALYTQNNILDLLPEAFEGIFYLVSGFLLAMFIHLPHKPKKHCHSCEH